MPDITMCGGTTFHLCGLCYRRTAKPSYRQSWFSEPPLKDDGTCSEFIEPQHRDSVLPKVNK